MEQKDANHILGQAYYHRLNNNFEEALNCLLMLRGYLHVGASVEECNGQVFQKVCDQQGKQVAISWLALETSLSRRLNGSKQAMTWAKRAQELAPLETDTTTGNQEHWPPTRATMNDDNRF